jgi:hypothetical protein
MKQEMTTTGNDKDMGGMVHPHPLYTSSVIATGQVE